MLIGPVWVDVSVWVNHSRLAWHGQLSIGSPHAVTPDNLGISSKICLLRLASVWT